MSVRDSSLRLTVASWLAIPSAPASSALSRSPSSLVFLPASSLLPLNRPCCPSTGLAWHRLRPGQGWRNLLTPAWGNMSCPGLEPGISGSGGRRLIH